MQHKNQTNLRKFLANKASNRLLLRFYTLFTTDKIPLITWHRPNFNSLSRLIRR